MNQAMDYAVHALATVSTPVYMALAVGIAAVITFGLRVASFGIKGALQGSALLDNLGRWMPLGAMLILLVYCLNAVEWKMDSTGIAYGVASLVTVAIHVWRHNAVLSIVSGTVTCAVLLALI